MRMYKYELPLSDRVELRMPSDAAIVTTQMQGDKICLWAAVTPELPLTPRFFQIVGTGQDIPDLATYVGTVQQSRFVWHIFELWNDPKLFEGPEDAA